MQSQHARRGAIACAVLLAVACNRKDEAKQNTARQAASGTQTQTTVSADEAKKAGPQAAIWPDGYLLVSEEEWVPVVNEAGQKLQAARAAFVAGESDKAASAIRAASALVKQDQTEAKQADKPRLERVVTALDGLAQRVDENKVEREAFDTTLASAYRDDAMTSWLYLKQETLQPTFERPREHFAHALDLLARHEGAAAADEIRRGAGYFRMAAESARADDKPLLAENVQKLSELAKRAATSELDPAELRGALSKVDAVYAASYLHQAEQRYDAKEHREAGRALREAAARLKARLEWLGKQGESASSAVLEELESVASKLEQGLSVAGRSVKSSFKRAWGELQSDDDAAAKRPHG